jgi:hypothetical protein
MPELKGAFHFFDASEPYFWHKQEQPRLSIFGKLLAIVDFVHIQSQQEPKKRVLFVPSTISDL